MNKKVDAKVKMYQRVLDVLGENQGSWGSKPAFVSAWSSLNNTIDTLQNHLTLQEKPINGFAIQKKHAREAMVKLVGAASGLITAYALPLDNQTLIQGHKLTRSKMLVIRESELKLHVERVLSDINSHMSELEDYGITLEMKDAITASFNKWLGLMKVPRKAINERKSDGNSIRELLKVGDNLLHNTIDQLMRPFELSEPKFYFEYRSTRMLLEARGRNDDVNPSTSDPF